MTTIPLWALGKSIANITHYSLKHLNRNLFGFLLNSMLLEFCRGRGEDLCVRSIERWLQRAQVTEWQCREWCRLLSMASLTTAIFLGVHTVFTLSHFFFNVESVASKFQTQDLMA
jgi:hypothetical protein